MIPQNVIDNIENVANIVSVIADYVKVNKAGANFKAICPFHEDKDASLVISPSKKIWKCFGCQAGGNIFTFIEKHENVSFPEAVKMLGKECNIDVPEKEMTEQERQQLNQREEQIIALSAGQAYFRDNRSNDAVLDYIKERDVSFKALEYFGYGFAPKNFTGLTKSLTSKGFATKALIEVGLTNKKDTKLYDRFINRLTFPYHSLSGNIIGFIGRDLGKDSQVKYMNSPDTSLFNKGDVLFGLYQARTHIISKDECFLVEGQMDVVAMFTADHLNTVCGSGTALTITQANSIRKFTNNVTILYDGDSAGVKASIRNTDILLSAGLNVRAVLLPAKHDPDSFIKEKGKKDFNKWLVKHRVDFITFIYTVFNDELNDPIRKTEVTKLIAQSIAMVPDKLHRSNYINNLSVRFNADADVLTQLVEQSHVPKKPTPIKSTEPGLYGLDDAKEFVGQGRKEITVTADTAIYSRDWGANPTVYVVGTPNTADIQELRSISPVIVCADIIELDDDLKEPAILEFLLTLQANGFNVTIKTTTVTHDEIVDIVTKEVQVKRIEKEELFSLLEYYVMLYSQYSDSIASEKRIAIERSAKMISFADSTTRAIKTKDYAAMLGVTKGALEEIIKPHIDLRNSEKKFKNDFNPEEDDGQFSFNPSELPSYVEEDPEMYRLYQYHNFFPLLDAKQRKVAYIFQQKGTFHRVGNFHIEPLLHIYDKDPELNKRVVEITQRRTPHPFYMEWVSKDMINMQSFRQRIANETDMYFSNGNQGYLDSINESWEAKFTRCVELHMYGYHREDFFAFSNAIYHKEDDKWQLQMVNDLGLVSHKNENFYIPAFSKIYENERRNSDKYYLDRFVMYREPTKSMSLEEWAKLIDEVYKENHNGKWAILYMFMCAFRSDIFEIDRIFTCLFFIGPTGSGKSEIAYSIRSIFQAAEAPVFNLNQGTAAAMFTLMEKYRDIPVIMEEYNDVQIEDVKFQGLKAAVYDGEGKQKRKDATSKELDASEINSPLIICGQEAPQRDDNSLGNRSIVRPVPKKDNRTDHEDAIFKILKDQQRAGLQNILLEVLQLRPTFKANYTRIQRSEYKKLRDNVRPSITSSDGLSRILNTYSMFMATSKLIEEHTSIKLPFTTEEFSKIAQEELIKQVESISTSNRIFTFFSTIGYLIDNGSVLEGRDFKIEQPGKITLVKRGRETYQRDLQPTDMRLLHISLENVYREYSRTIGYREALTKQSLMAYLQSNEAWIGQCRSTRFQWMESVETTSGLRIQKDFDESVVDPTMRRIMEPRGKTTSSIVLNYDILKDLLDVDFERGEEEKEEKEF